MHRIPATGQVWSVLASEPQGKDSNCTRVGLPASVNVSRHSSGALRLPRPMLLR